MNPYDIDANSTNRSNQVIQIDNGKHVAAVAICAAICGMCLSMVFWLDHKVTHIERDQELVKYYLMDPHSRTPEELAAWSKFRKEHEHDEEK